eukprot:Pgem_evm1s18668
MEKENFEKQQQSLMDAKLQAEKEKFARELEAQKQAFEAQQQQLIAQKQKLEQEKI